MDTWVCLAVLPLLAIVVYIAPMIYCTWRGEVDVVRRYGKAWAVVTGGSSGIGLALATRLAAQGVDVVLVARNVDRLEHARRYLTATFPENRFVAVAADLRRDADAVAAVARATEELDVRLVFSNAGFLRMHDYAASDMGLHVDSLACCVAAPLALAHLFANRLREHGRRGAIVFTSSQTAFWPMPYAAMYGAEKAFLSSFASSLAAELRPDGIDILAVRPAHVETNLFARLPDLYIFRALRAVGQRPDDIARVVLSSLGRMTVRDTGFFTLFAHGVASVLGPNACARAMMQAARILPDYRRFRTAR